MAELAPVKIPILAVLGNHDYESGNAEEVKKILTDARRARARRRLRSRSTGVGFAGVKGFGGGFGRRTLEPWGEDATKAFVHEAVAEALKLESRAGPAAHAAARRRAALRAHRGHGGRRAARDLPVPRLEPPRGAAQPLPVAVAFHGHAHRGAPEGRTSAGIPVYNVAHARCSGARCPSSSR